MVDVGKVAEMVFNDKLLDTMAGTDRLVLTEAKLDEMEMKREKLPDDYVRVSQTLTWWASRQKTMDKRLQERRKTLSRASNGDARNGVAHEAGGANGKVDAGKAQNGAKEGESNGKVAVGAKVSFKLPWQ